MKTVIKYLLVSVSSLLVFTLIWFCLVYDFRGEKILIPYDYQGTCIIFYNVHDGEIKKTDGYFGRIILKIPANGVLTVNFQDAVSRKTPIYNREYYLYDTKTGGVISQITVGEFDINNNMLLVTAPIAVFSSDKIPPTRFESFRLFQHKEFQFFNKKVDLENTFITKKIVYE
ncbi:hypothetical protein [Runella sp.]|uniref:hypothetical protein n=1 Tax=Runella sp. TaxID=1960881 RepID=UPI003D0CEFB7